MGRALPSMTLQITQDCNFRCSYCPYTSNIGNNRLHQNKKMDIETAKKAIDFLEEHSADSTSINIGFYGGEPLMEYEMIKELIAYAEQKFIMKDLSFTMTTNGSLLSREKIEFFSKHKMNITISLDGIKEINDKNRVFANSDKGTFDYVIKNLKIIMQDFEEFSSHVFINMVVDPSNDPDEINKIFDIEGMGTKIHIRNNSLDDSDKEEKAVASDIFISKMRYQMFVEYVKYIRGEEDGKQGIAKQNMMDTCAKMDEIANGNMMPQKGMHGGPCKPGSKMFVDVEGRILPCEKVSENIPGMEIGNIYQGFFLQNAKKILNVGQEMEHKCKKCWCIQNCHFCIKESNNVDICKESKLDFYKLLRLKIMMKEMKRLHEEILHEEKYNYLSNYS